MEKYFCVFLDGFLRIENWQRKQSYQKTEKKNTQKTESKTLDAIPMQVIENTIWIKTENKNNLSPPLDIEVLTTSPSLNFCNMGDHCGGGCKTLGHQESPQE